MNLWILIPLTLVCFAVGVFLSRWQARKQYRAHMADRVAREVEKEIARRAVERFAEKQEDGKTENGKRKTEDGKR